MRSMKIRVGKAGKRGRGIFATSKIEKGRVIETSPYVECSERDQEYLCKTRLNFYQFEASPVKRTTGFGLGFISLYNHSKKPNATYWVNRTRQTITVTALRDLKRGEEILINYGYDATVHNVANHEASVKREQEAQLAALKEDALEEKEEKYAVPTMPIGDDSYSGDSIRPAVPLLPDV